VNVDGTRVVAWGNGDWDRYWIGLDWAKQEPTFRQKWGKVLITHKDVGTRNKNYSYKGNRKGKDMERKPVKVLWQMIRSRLGGWAQNVIDRSRPGKPRKDAAPRKDHNALNWPTNWPPFGLAHFSEINGQ